MATKGLMTTKVPMATKVQNGNKSGLLKNESIDVCKKRGNKKSSPPISPRQARNAILTVKLYIPKFLALLGYSIFPCVNVALFLTGGGTSSVKVRP